MLSDGLTPPIKGLFVYNCNALVSVPDQNAVLEGLKREDLFAVVSEQVMTDTARYADILIPATTFFPNITTCAEAMGATSWAAFSRLLGGGGEARPNVEVFAALGRAMAFPDEPFSWNGHTALEKLVAAFEVHEGAADGRILDAGGIQRYDFPGPSAVQFKTVFPRTRDGKIHLAPAVLGSKPYRSSWRHPAVMIRGRVSLYL